MKHLLAPLALFALLGCGGPKTRVDPDVQLSIHKESALAYYASGDLDRAEDQALRGISLDRKDISLRLMLGWIHLRRGSTDNLYKARAVFEDFARDEEPRADLGLAETLERLGRVHQETADSIEAGERFAPEGDAESGAAKLRQDASELFEQSRVAYQRVLDRQMDNLKALNGMQRVHSLEGDYETALAYSDRLIEVASSERDALRTNLADPEQILTDRWEQNLRDVARSTENLLTETHLFAYSLAQALGDPAKACSHLDAAIQMRPDDAEMWSRRAQLNFELGDYERSIEDVMQFVKLSDKAFEHPDIRRAWDLKNQAEQRLR